MKRLINQVLSRFRVLVVSIYIDGAKVGYGIRRMVEGELLKNEEDLT